jgi:hypothetical protein
MFQCRVSTFWAPSCHGDPGNGSFCPPGPRQACGHQHIALAVTGIFVPSITLRVFFDPLLLPAEPASLGAGAGPAAVSRVAPKDLGMGLSR